MPDCSMLPTNVEAPSQGGRPPSVQRDCVPTTTPARAHRPLRPAAPAARQPTSALRARTQFSPTRRMWLSRPRCCGARRSAMEAQPGVARHHQRVAARLGELVAHQHNLQGAKAPETSVQERRWLDICAIPEALRLPHK